MGIMDVLGAVLKPVADYFGRKQEIKAQEHSADMALRDAQLQRQVQLIHEGLTADMNWEMEFARQAASSWKDEYTLLVVSVPLVMAFIPGMSQYVVAGFNAFASTPAWYQIMVQTIFYATYGIRLWRRKQGDDATT